MKKNKVSLVLINTMCYVIHNDKRITMNTGGYNVII